MKYAELRAEIVAACQSMNSRGLNQGMTGNISARIPEGFLISPSGMSYDEMTPADMVIMHLDGTHEGTRRPASSQGRPQQHHATRWQTLARALREHLQDDQPAKTVSDQVHLVRPKSVHQRRQPAGVQLQIRRY